MSPRVRRFATAVACLTGCTASFPISADIAEGAKNEVAPELAECAAYYIIGAAISSNESVPQELRDTAVEQQRRAAERALTLRS